MHSTFTTALCLVLFLFTRDATSVPSLAFKGVNLGGWFILEKFLNPDFIGQGRGVMDEYSYVQRARANNDQAAIQKLRDHWNNYYTEDDWKAMADFGINTIRWPVPYWTFATQQDLDAHGEPYLTGQWPIILKHLRFARKYGIAVIFDLHAAPGSQNGFDNSGRTGGKAVIQWGKGDTIDRTVAYIEVLCQWVLQAEKDPETAGAVIGIELLNEPAGYGGGVDGGADTIKSYYLKGYDAVRKYLPANNYYVVIEQGFLFDTWVGFMSEAKYKNVILDMHLYQCFEDWQRQATFDQHLKMSCTDLPAQRLAIQTLPVIVGEWSAAYKTDSGSAQFEARPDNAAQIDFMKRNVAAQMYTSFINPSVGNFYWAWKTYNRQPAAMWDMQMGITGGWVTYDDAYINNACAGRTTPQAKGVKFNWIDRRNSTYVASSTSSTSSTSSSSSTRSTSSTTTSSTTSSASSTTSSIDSSPSTPIDEFQQTTASDVPADTSDREQRSSSAVVTVLPMVTLALVLLTTI